jgi:hypothetical protein
MRHLAASLAAVWAALGSGTPAEAEIHDYMILRLVYLETTCGTDTLSRLEAPQHHRRFRIHCRNTSAYPDGLTVLCTDIDDDRSCIVETQPREFRDLRLLQPGPDGPQ